MRTLPPDSKFGSLPPAHPKLTLLYENASARNPLANGVATNPGAAVIAPDVSAETIAARVRKAAEFLAPERITLNPDCGFAPGSGAVVSIDEAYRKLCNEAEAARILRAEFA